MEEQPADKGTALSLPVAIVAAGLVIAAAIIVTFGGRTIPAPAEGEQGDERAFLELMTPVGAGDHIRGNPEAGVFIVEYSDTECPFCKSFHQTLTRLVAEYDGRVAWVYRHFPLDSIHPKADKEAEALECAGEQGGNDAFWRYLDRLFEVTPSNDGLDPAALPQIARFVGLDEATFAGCLASGKYAGAVEEETENAIVSGGTGTPWSIIVAKDGTKYPVSGAQSYATVKQLVELALRAL